MPALLMLLLATPILLLATPILAQGAPPSQGAPRCSGETTNDRVLRIEQHGDVRTTAGRLLKLADIRLSEGARERLALFEDEDVLLSLDAIPDRWGRVSARMIGARDGQDAAELLLSEGLALVDTGESGGLCRPALLAAEGEARTRRTGIWASALVSASEPQVISDRAGQFTIVQGRIVSVGERPRWTYLNFGRDFRRDFAVSISRRNWQAMSRAGLSAEALRGRTVRIRGIVEMRRAPGMEITSAEMIELADDSGAHALHPSPTRAESGTPP